MGTWRTYGKVISTDSESITVNFPARENPDSSQGNTRIDKSWIPAEILDLLTPGVRFHVRTDLNTEKDENMYFSDWEVY